MSNEIFTTMMVFLDSANREIVKSALGFIKLAVHTYPTDVIREHLRPILGSLLGWSHGNRNHFKMPVRHICERLMRKIGYEELVACLEDNEDGKKILANIKKRKEHAKKKKAKAAEQDQVCVRIHSVSYIPSRSTKRPLAGNLLLNQLSKRCFMVMTRIARPGVTKRKILGAARRGEVFSLVLGFVSTTTSQWTYLSLP
jgi:hypothetical protein